MSDARERALVDAVALALKELDGLTKALALLGRVDLSAGIRRDIAGPLQDALESHP